MWLFFTCFFFNYLKITVSFLVCNNRCSYSNFLPHQKHNVILTICKIFRILCDYLLWALWTYFRLYRICVCSWERNRLWKVQHKGIHICRFPDLRISNSKEEINHQTGNYSFIPVQRNIWISNVDSHLFLIGYEWRALARNSFSVAK